MSSPHGLPPRLELFSDAVFAIIITIMVLELHPPHGATFEDLLPLLPIFLSYVLSFAYLIIYWNNHHHLLAALRAPTPPTGVMWANAHLLFWLSLVPFVTAWLGQNIGEIMPIVLYGVVMLGAACSYFVLQGKIVETHGTDSALARALGKDIKGRLSLAVYATAIVTAFFAPLISYILFVGVALMWFVPDRRVKVAHEN